MPGLYGLVSVFLAERLLKVMQTARRVPAIVIPHVKEFDPSNPAVFLTVRLPAVLTGLGTCTVMEAP